MQKDDCEWCRGFLTKISEWPMSEPFKESRQVLYDNGVATITDLERKIDLRVIEENLKRNEYMSVNEFIHDMRSVFEHTLLQVGEDHVLALMSKDLLVELDKSIKKRASGTGNKHREVVKLRKKLDAFLETS